MISIQRFQILCLAKICSKDQSIVTMTAARGTMGYIAPETYSRNFGTVSCKSNVYSFGMISLEMVSGRRNIDPMTGNETEDYFPEWIYDKLIEGEDLGLDSEMDYDEELRKLAMTTLWCIQWSPADRPSMTDGKLLEFGNATKTLCFFFRSIDMMLPLSLKYRWRHDIQYTYA